MELDKRNPNKLDKTFIEYPLSISFGLIKPVIELPLKTADRQAHNAASHCELVDQLFSAEAFQTKAENRKYLVFSPEGLRFKWLTR